MHWLPVYRCRLCARVWTGAYPIADLPERAAATPPHLFAAAHRDELRQVSAGNDRESWG